MASESETTYPCASNLTFGENYCKNEVVVPVKLNKKTGKKEDPHSQDRMCAACRAGIHFVPASFCKVLPEGDSDDSKKAAKEAALAANKYNGKGVPKNKEGYYGVIDKKFNQTFGTEAQVVVGNSHASVLDAERKKNAKTKAKTGQDVAVLMLVLYYDGKIPTDCSLDDVPMRLRDSNMVPLKFVHGQWCFQKLHPNDKGKGISKGKKRSFVEDALDETEGNKSPKTDINVKAAGKSEGTPVTMGKLEESDDESTYFDPSLERQSAEEQLETLCLEFFGADYKSVMHADVVKPCMHDV